LVCKESESASPDEDIWLSWSISSDSRLGLIFVSARNVTGQKNATRLLNEARLRAEEANQAKSDFLSVMSHELRTPLNPILGFAEMLSDEVADPEQRDILQTIVSSGQHMVQLIDEILDYSKAEAGRVEVVPVEFSLVDLVVEKMILMGGSLKRDEVKFSYELNRGAFKDKELPIFKGDADMLKHILRNLLANAIKFTAAGHVILRVTILSADDLNAMVSFEVEDTGIGIEPKAHAQIFEPFVQADSSQTRTYGGTGLGLAICKRLIELMGGAISVESEVGKGSVFRVTVPLELTARRDESDAQVARSTATPAKSATPQTKYTGLELLVVEDDASNSFFIMSLLKRYDFNPTLVSSGEKALEVIKEHSGPFAAIFLDLHMPGIGGLSALEEIRRMESLSGDTPVPIIILSADVEESTREECMNLGASTFLSKPLKIDALNEVLKKWVMPTESA
jgi:signal transduction histidine kinase/ActR/RegA family two-component response regulator